MTSMVGSISSSHAQLSEVNSEHATGNGNAMGG